MKQKGFTPILVLILIALAVIGYFGYKNYRPKTQVSPTPTTSQAPNGDLADWKTYTNTKFRYSFKYPSDWEIVSVDGSIDKSPLVPSPQPSLGKNLVMVYLKRGIQGVEDKSMQLDIHTLDNPKNLTLHEYFIDQKWGNEYLKLMQDLKINNMEAVNLKFSGTPGGYYINFGENIINLQFSYTETNEKFEIPPQQIFDQILSTFKFLGAETETCQPTFPIETNMPELTASENYAMECSSKQTKSDCLSMDVYNAKIKDFSKPDGIPDCIWTTTD